MPPDPREIVARLRALAGDTMEAGVRDGDEVYIARLFTDLAADLEAALAGARVKPLSYVDGATLVLNAPHLVIPMEKTDAC